MSLSIFPQAVQEFQAAVSEVENYLRFVALANQLRPWLGKMVDWQNLGATEKGQLQNFISHKDYDVAVGYNGLIVSIAGAFEHLVRRIVREGVVWINAKRDEFEKLPAALIQQNLIRTGHALVTISEPPVEVNYDYEAMCKNLGTCYRGGGKVVLNAEAFSVSILNINQERIAESLSRIGIELNWDDFGNHVKLQQLFGAKLGRRTTTEVIGYLKDFVKLRNRIAHCGLAVQATQSQVEFALSFFAQFGPSLAEAAETALRKLHK